MIWIVAYVCVSVIIWWLTANDIAPEESWRGQLAEVLLAFLWPLYVFPIGHLMAWLLKLKPAAKKENG